MRRSLGVLLTLCACARDGAGEGLFDPGQEVQAPDAQAVDAERRQSDAPAGPESADAALEAADPITDAGPRAVGDLCASDAQCENAACVLVHNGGHAAYLCTRPCNPFAPCINGTACYDDGTSRVCVHGCTDAAAACPSGLSCLPTYPPEKGCLPTQ